MNQNLGLLMKIIAKSTLKFVMIIASGLGFCLLSIIISYYSLSHQRESGSASGHTDDTSSPFAVVLSWFAVDIWSAILFFSSIIVFPIVYFMVANKSAIQTAIHLIWSNKLSDWIGPKVTHYLQKLEGKQPNWMKTTSDKTVVKLKLLEATKNDSETPALQKRVIAFLLNRVKLDDVDFQRDSVSVGSIISDKLLQTLNDVASPSNTLLWVVYGIHLILFVLPLIL